MALLEQLLDEVGVHLRLVAAVLRVAGRRSAFGEMARRAGGGDIDGVPFDEDAGARIAVRPGESACGTAAAVAGVEGHIGVADFVQVSVERVDVGVGVVLVVVVVVAAECGVVVRWIVSDACAGPQPESGQNNV